MGIEKALICDNSSRLTFTKSSHPYELVDIEIQNDDKNCIYTLRREQLELVIEKLSGYLKEFDEYKEFVRS